MNRTDSDRLERVRGNLAAYERILDDPAVPFNAPEWAGVLAYNVKELLDMVDRMDARDDRPLLHLNRHDLTVLANSGDAGALAEWRAREAGGTPAAAPVPSGTGWPVP